MDGSAFWGSPCDDAIDWDDPFDPRTWETNPEVASLLPWVTFWVGGDAHVSPVLLDRVDADLPRRYNYCLNRKHLHRRHVLYYVCRCDRTEGQRTVYLHREVCGRIGNPPSLAHRIVDHVNGNGLDCRRRNLRWVTVAENNRNRFGRRSFEREHS